MVRTVPQVTYLGLWTTRASLPWAILLVGACSSGAGSPSGAGGLGGDGPVLAGPTHEGAGGAAGAVSHPEDECRTTPSFFATGVVSHRFGPGQDFGRDRFPELVLGPPRGGGLNAGSLHVVSLGEGGSVTLEFDGNTIVDGPGADFIVFENPFHPEGQPESVFAELGVVAVSQDGRDWVAYDCAAGSYPYGSCGGWRPVLANSEGNDLDARDPNQAGGDPFDLADVGLAWARYVRISDADQPGTFDLDAVSIVHAACE